VTVRAAVNQIDAAVSSVAKHNHRHARHVEFHDSFADRKLLQRHGRFRNDHRVPFHHLLVAVVRRRSDDVARGLDRGAVARAALDSLLLARRSVGSLIPKNLILKNLILKRLALNLAVAARRLMIL
jgi:hypothetical protein